MHWTNAVAMVVMIGSGWGIYNNSVIFSVLHFGKPFRIGNWAAESLQWHFAGMWLLVLNGAAYLLYALLTGMAVIVGLDVALTLLVPQTLWAMLTGGPRLPARVAWP